MQALKYIVLFLVVCVAIDSIWLIGNKKAHHEQIERVQHAPLKADGIAAAGFYVLAAIMFFLIVVKIAGNDPKKAMIYGALLGLAMYGTFDLTNKALFKDYTWKYAISDTLWGTFAISAASGATVWLMNKLK